MERETTGRLSAGGLSLEGAASGFSELVAEYRRLAACVEGIAGVCDGAGVPRSQVLDIAFGSVVRRIREGADLMEAVAGRFRAAAGGSATGADGSGRSPAPGPDDPIGPGPDDPDEFACSGASLADAPRLLVAVGRALEDAMLRALDLVDRADRPDLVGDSHPFGHVIHGICVPYILLAAEELERR